MRFDYASLADGRSDLGRPCLVLAAKFRTARRTLVMAPTKCSPVAALQDRVSTATECLNGWDRDQRSSLVRMEHFALHSFPKGNPLMKSTAFAVALAFLLVGPDIPPSYGDPRHSVDPPAGARLVLKAMGKGVQIYTCQQTIEGYRWKFIAPMATLFDSAGQEIGRHFAGPTWAARDGSTVVGAVLAQAASLDLHSVAWLLLKVTSRHGSGVLNNVAFVRRIETEGGLAPAQGCDAAHEQEQERVPYTARYLFYSVSR